MKTAVISLTLAVLYLCILQADSQIKKVCTTYAWRGGCKKAGKLKIEKLKLRNLQGCSRECAKRKNCMAFDFPHPKKVRKGKVNICNLFRAGCTKQPAGHKVFYTCTVISTLTGSSNEGKAKKLKINGPGCGEPTKDAQGRVIGGKPAVRGQFPWQVGIMRKTTHKSFRKSGLAQFRDVRKRTHWYETAKNLFAHCGGSLLNERYVLTAAHCFSNDVGAYDPQDVNEVPELEPKRYMVLLGRNNLGPKEKKKVGGKTVLDGEKTGSARIAIKRIIIHPGWNPGENANNQSSNSYDNDIALLELAKDATYGDYIKPVCIPRSVEKMRKINKDSCRISGWGHTIRPQNKKLGLSAGVTKYNIVSLQPVLQYAKIPEVDWNMCSDAFLKRMRWNSLTRNQFCAGTADGKKDACQGDSGGPFVCSEHGKKAKGKDKFFQLGVVSFGDQCGKAGSYGKYAKVIKYAKWIEKEATKRT